MQSVKTHLKFKKMVESDDIFEGVVDRLLVLWKQREYLVD